MMSKIPTTASSEAAAVCGIPWSWAAGMKCVPTRPLVEAPHTANDPARSQKTPRREATLSESMAIRAGL